MPGTDVRCRRLSARWRYNLAMPIKRRHAGGLHRVLGTAALFSTAYGNVGSSIYYALGLVTAYALGLTPVAFFICGAIFFFTAVTYAEATARFPEAGGSSSFTRHAFNEAVSFFAGWAQMLNYTVTIAISAIFVPHYLAKFWPGGHLDTHPNDIYGGAIVVAFLVALNIVGVKEAAGLNIFLALADLATQALLVVIGLFTVFSPSVLQANVEPGRHADLARLHHLDPGGDGRLHRHRDDLEHGRGGDRPAPPCAPLDHVRGAGRVRDLRVPAVGGAVGAAGPPSRWDRRRQRQHLPVHARRRPEAGRPDLRRLPAATPAIRWRGVVANLGLPSTVTSGLSSTWRSWRPPS